MKVRYLSFLVLLVTVFGCNQDEENLQALNGTYMGIFVRDQQAAKVELSFDNGTYQGYSERFKFPALCRGTYTVSGSKITFVNDCPWTAEFDWTLILSGEWDFKLTGNILILTSSSGDKYTLTPAIRANRFYVETSTLGNIAPTPGSLKSAVLPDPGYHAGFCCGN